jgi:hypothetical protein
MSGHSIKNSLLRHPSRFWSQGCPRIWHAVTLNAPYPNGRRGTNDLSATRGTRRATFFGQPRFTHHPSASLREGSRCLAVALACLFILVVQRVAVTPFAEATAVGRPLTRPGRSEELGALFTAIVDVVEVSFVTVTCHGPLLRADSVSGVLVGAASMMLSPPGPGGQSVLPGVHRLSLALS